MHPITKDAASSDVLRVRLERAEQNRSSNAVVNLRRKLRCARNAAEAQLQCSVMGNQGVENFGYLKHRAVFNSFHAGTQANELLAIQHRRHRACDLAERRQYDSELILRDPVGV